VIERFDREFRFLSNFYEAPFEVGGVRYATVEHYFQAQKTTDPAAREEIVRARSAVEAKRLGQKVELREDWPQVRDGVMLVALRAKFDQNPDLRERLVATYPEILQEGNYWHDNYWGVCQCERCQPVAAQNMLGRLLMALRYSYICENADNVSNGVS